MESDAVKFYMLLSSILGFILIHLLFFEAAPLIFKSCPDQCYLTGWPFGSYEHKAALMVSQVGAATSVSAVGWLLNSIIGTSLGAGIGLLVGNHLVREGKAIKFPVYVPEKECVDDYRNGSSATQPDQDQAEEQK